MKLVKPSLEIWTQYPSLEGVYKIIERAGRICYKSESSITEDSAKPFVDRLINSDHLSVLEHGTLYMKVPFRVFTDLDESVTYKSWNRFVIHWKYPDVVFLSTNYRWIVESHLEDWLQYLCEPTEYHEKRVTVHFILSRSIAQEFTRHRVFSYSMESQRYCNYSKDKFEKEVTFIIPSWLDHWDEGRIQYRDFEKSGSGSVDSGIFINGLLNSERDYFRLLNEGWKPQQAREILPNSCKTELVMTGFISQWKDFFEQRCDSKAHPQARQLAIPLHVEFINRNYIK